MASGEVEKGISVCSISEEFVNLKCEPCHEDGNIREAVGMCVDCQEYLCQKCFDCHTLPKPWRDHQLLDKQQMFQSQSHMAIQDKCTERCIRHTGEIIKYYCTGHCKLACSICLNHDHRTCDGVLFIPDVAGDLKNNEEYKQAEKHLKSVLATLKKISDEGGNIIQILTKSCNEAVQRLEEFGQSINEALDKAKTKLLERAEEIMVNERGKIDAVIDKYHETLEELEKMMTDVARLQSTRRHCDMFTLMMKTNDQLGSVDREAVEIEANCMMPTSKIQFTPNLQILDIPMSPESVGKMSDVPIGMVVGAEHVKDINVRTGLDVNDCLITGCIVLRDNTLVVSDNRNSSIKAVDDRRGKLTAEKKLPSHPWDITMIDANHVAVTLPEERKVAFVTVASTITIDRTLDVKGHCYGIHYRNGKLAVSFNDPDKVQILDSQGTILHNISTDKQGNTIFNSSDYVNFGRNPTTLFVSNCGSNSVVCVRLDGTITARYTDKQLRHPSKAVVDGGGHLLVCGSASHNVHQITPDGRKVRMLLGDTDGLWRPRSISYSETEKQFYIGMDRNNVKVFRAVFGIK